MKILNYDLMTGKGNKHLKDWSECSLSLLDKIQIFNTFSISQYLHIKQDIINRAKENGCFAVVDFHSV